MYKYMFKTLTRKKTTICDNLPPNTPISTFPVTSNNIKNGFTEMLYLVFLRNIKRN